MLERPRERRVQNTPGLAIVLTAIGGSVASGPAVLLLSGLLLAVLVGWLLPLAAGLLARA